MEWLALILFSTWKYGEDVKELRREADAEEKKYEKWEREDNERFLKSLEGMTPEQVADAYRMRGAAISAAAVCAAACCL